MDDFDFSRLYQAFLKSLPRKKDSISEIEQAFVARAYRDIYAKDSHDTIYLLDLGQQFLDECGRPLGPIV